MPDKEIRRIRFDEPDYLDKIAKILTNNIKLNNTLHLKLIKPLDKINPSDLPTYIYRSNDSFNSLLTRLDPKMNYIYINRYNTDITFNKEYLDMPNYLVIKIPKGFSRIVYTHSYKLIQFFNPFPQEAELGPPIDTPVILSDTPHLPVVPATPPLPVVPDTNPPKKLYSQVVGAKLLVDYYKKYLKYKNKYIQLKGL